VIISSEGYILTNDHVVGNADVITIRLADGREFEGVVSDTDPRRDLAILKIDPPDDLPVVEMGDSSEILIGEWVIALGSPFGFYLQDPQPSVSVGVVSAVGRSFVTSSQGRLRYFPSTIQTDAAINPGNSGGPLVNALGEVIGINSFILSQSGGSVGIGFAIPINQVKEALDQIRTYGYIRRAWTGIQTDDNNMLYVRRYGIRNEVGILVVDIERGSPAADAALNRGDLIVGVNGEEMRDNSSFETLLLKADIDDRIEIEYYPYRENRRRNTVLVVGELPRGGQ
jgi:serine protease Do